MSTPTAADLPTGQDDIQSPPPDLTTVFPEIAALSEAAHYALRNGRVPQTTIGLMQLRAWQVVGGTFHSIGSTRQLRAAGESEARITAVATWRDAPYFTGAERVALELAEAVLAPNPFGERVSDELFTRAAAHYDDAALWTLTIALGQFYLFVPVVLVGRPIPGRRPGTNHGS
ncbi:carboxymuconolactone decarboxylase family protein [Murinocardiopsis flavida]|uniref:Carboxymuconolactone decarboxylase family protein n=1 Tax=Murinocardiopsis flavida TaxID=645275 RepID=A0A2P8CJB2_9ACTN|nr:carboxymuconolactone decarboxylase family protein [Murinocardiopsis flavida]PSK85051.1 carboxymuconolactone decarboxylase family protein [Murinocardiopsis flavida]